MKYIMIAILLFLSAPAHALCLGVGLKNVPATATYVGGSGGYAIYDAAEHMQTGSFQVETLVAALSCNYYIVFSAGNSNNPTQRVLNRTGGNTLDYNVYTTASKTSVIKDFATAAVGERINGSFGIVAIGASNLHNFYWTPPALRVVPAGAAFFSDTLTISLYQEKIFSNN